MIELAERLREIRKHFGNPSARKLSQELGVAINAWGQWETGNILPSASALFALANRGIDVHWLLVGEGAMLRAQAPEDSDKRSMGLNQLLSSPGSSFWKQRIEIVAELARGYPRALDVHELMNTLKMTREQVSVCLLVLVSLGKVVIRHQDGELLYAATGLEDGVPERSEDDKLEMVVDILRFIGTDVLAACQGVPARGVIFDGRAFVTGGRAFIDSVLASIKREAIVQHSADGECVRLVIAALTE